MWRRAVARCHPDAGGDHDLFIWITATRDHVIGGELGQTIPRRERSHNHQRSYSEASPDPARIPFDKAGGFADLTAQALRAAQDLAEPYAGLLRLLADCYEAPEADSTLHRQQCQGATYKTLAAIGHRAGMSKPERARWYRIAESIPLSQRHAGHILSRLQRSSEAA